MWKAHLPTQWNTHSSLAHRDYPGQVTCKATKQVSIKKIKMIQSTFSGYNGMKLDLYSKRETGKLANTWKVPLLTAKGAKKKAWVRLQDRDKKNPSKPKHEMQ